MQKRTCVWVLALLAWPSRSPGYYEDDLAKTKSSAHYDLTLAMAVCAGYNLDEANLLANADEATDRTDYGSGSDEAQFHFTSRSGKNMHYFHYPTAVSLPEIKGWGSGSGSLDIDQGSGTSTSCTHCCFNGTHCVDGNTLQAFGIQIHSMGDQYSHMACVKAGGTDHSNYDSTLPAQEAYCPILQHTCEWGALNGSDLSGTACKVITAAQATTLRKNAIAGLKVVRDAIYSRAQGAGKAAVYVVSDSDLSAFAGNSSGEARTLFAITLQNKCNPPGIGNQRGEPAIDPWALIFGSDSTTYIKLTLPDPAPIGVVTERTRASLRKLSPAGRRASQARIQLLQQYLHTMERELQ